MEEWSPTFKSWFWVWDYYTELDIWISDWEKNNNNSILWLRLNQRALSHLRTIRRVIEPPNKFHSGEWNDINQLHTINLKRQWKANIKLHHIPWVYLFIPLLNNCVFITYYVPGLPYMWEHPNKTDKNSCPHRAYVQMGLGKITDLKRNI